MTEQLLIAYGEAYGKQTEELLEKLSLDYLNTIKTHVHYSTKETILLSLQVCMAEYHRQANVLRIKLEREFLNELK